MDDFFGVFQRIGPFARDLLRHLKRSSHKVLRGHHLIDQTYFPRSSRIDDLRGEDELFCASFAHESGEPLGT